MAVLGDACSRAWKEVAAVCHDAAVFLDDGAGETLHWTGGFSLLEGSVGVYDLFGELNPVARDFISKVCRLILKKGCMSSTLDIHVVILSQNLFYRLHIVML